MKRLVMAVILCLCLAFPSLAQRTSEQSHVEADRSLAEQLKESPDSKPLFDKYMAKNLAEVHSFINRDPDKAEERLTAIHELILSLEPKTDAGKQLLRRYISRVRVYEGRVELVRVTLEQLVARLEENPDDIKSISMYQSRLNLDLGPLTRNEPDKAEELLSAAKSFVAAIKAQAQQDSSRRMLSRIESSLGALEKRIAIGRKLTAKRAALIGASAAPLDVDDWANGESLNDTDLKGKVVLLDFWAVWCEASVARFPYLREWHEEYANQGLVMIGLTRYYNYRWDKRAGRAQFARRGEQVSPEQERAMLAKFAEQHDLPHSFAIQNDRSLSDYYAVTRIPHVVLIDRTGTVRLIRVDNLPDNASDISQTLAKLIAE